MGAARATAVNARGSREGVDLAELLDRRRAEDEVLDAHLGVEELGAAVVALGPRLLPLLLLQHVHRLVLLLHHAKDMLRVEELRVDRGVLEAAADDEDLGRLGARGLRLGRLHLVEQRVEHVQQRVVVVRAEDLGDKGAARLQKLGGEAQRGQRELVLAEGVLEPRRADVGRAVVQHHVDNVALELTLERGAALLGRDVLHERRALGNGLDRRQVDANDRRVLRHDLTRRLHPRSRRCAQVQASLGLAQELELLVELQQLERGTRAVPTLLGEVVELVQALLRHLILARHPDLRSGDSLPPPARVTLEGGRARRPRARLWWSVINPPLTTESPTTHYCTVLRPLLLLLLFSAVNALADAWCVAVESTAICVVLLRHAVCSALTHT